MEGYNSLKDFTKNPITFVSIKFEETSVDHDILLNYLHHLTHSRTVSDLHKRISQSIIKLNLLDSFSGCKASVYPGKLIDTAEVRFKLYDKRNVGGNIGFDSDPFKLSLIGYLRNFYHRPSISTLQLNSDITMKNVDFEFIHNDKLTFQNYLQSALKIGTYSEPLDVNIEEKSYGGSISLSTHDKKHLIEIGRNVRTNIITTENASAELLKNAILPTDKNYISYTYYYKNDEFDPNSAFNLDFQLKNEWAIGKKLWYHKIEANVNHYYYFNKSTYLWNTLNLGYIPNLFSNRYHINDTFRYKNVKGFKYLGRREKPHDDFLVDKINVPGDFLGSRSQVTLESKIISKGFPFFNKFGISPFIYTNFAYIPEKSNFKENLRASTGFGLCWDLAIGRLEFSYASKVWKQEGDRSAEFQAFFTTRDKL